MKDESRPGFRFILHPSSFILSDWGRKVRASQGAAVGNAHPRQRLASRVRAANGRDSATESNTANWQCRSAECRCQEA